MMKKVLIIAQVHQVLVEKLDALGYQCELREDMNPAQCFACIADYEGMITSNKLEVRAPLIDAGLRLKWIGRLGSGMEIIDTEYAREKGIACFNSPEGNANAVAEQALGMLLGLRHHIFKSNLEIRNGQWLRDENRGTEIEGKTAGIIGLGHNGSAFAQKLLGMGVRVLAYDKFKNNYALPGIQTCDDLDLIFNNADILSFHVPLSAETRYYFNAGFLGSMQKSFVLLNLSRGPVVSLQALYEGMKSGKITAAALDVWEEEPYWKMPEVLRRMADELLALPNFIGTPHIGGYSVEAFYKMSRTLAEKIEKFSRSV
jgi:D-3-phosphoglycerate dehydrogenase